MCFISKSKNLNRKVLVCLSLLFVYGLSGKIRAQTIDDTIHFSLQDAIQRGVDSSKTLIISTARIDEAMARWKQTRDAILPHISIGFNPSEAFILTRTLQIDGMMREPMKLPSHTTLYMGNLSISQTIFAGNQYRYAQKSAALLHQIAQYNAASDSEDVKIDLIQSYINLYKIDENQKVLQKELVDVMERLKEVEQFRDQGLATDNDVLRFKLQKANVELAQIDLYNNRMIANYALGILLKLPVGTYISVDTTLFYPEQVPGLQELTQTAMRERSEIAVYNTQNQLSAIQIKKIKGQKLPTIGAGISSYYINPNSKFFPDKHTFLFPITIGLNLGWNISSLYTTKNKVAEAEIQKKEVEVAQSATVDQISMDVYNHYLNYLQSLKKIQLLQTSIEQAHENDRIMELKYQNQLATTTDRIDAQTLLYQSLINLNIAKADASTAYYKLLKATGKLNKSLTF